MSKLEEKIQSTLILSDPLIRQLFNESRRQPMQIMLTAMIVLGESGFHVTTVVWTFFIIMTAIIWIGIKYPKTKKEETESAVAAPQMAE